MIEETAGAAPAPAVGRADAPTPAQGDRPDRGATDAPRPGPPRHVAALDGLRALAILAVMAVHAGVPGASLGWLAVDLFFVLSGFLITTLLADEFARDGRVSLGRFWGRRFLRLMPVYWLYVGALTAAMVVFGWGWTRPHGGWSVGGYDASLWFYFANYAPMGGIWEHQWLALHLWSLSVEEQFYFAWPVLCVLALRLGRAAALAWVLVALVMARRLAGGQSISHLDTRGLGLVVGCAAALSLRGAHAAGARRLLARGGARAAIVLATALLVAGATYARGHGAGEADIHRWVVPPAVALFAALIATLWHAPGGALGAALSLRPLAYLGKISYSMYIYHMYTHYLTWDVLTRGLEAWPRGPKFAARLLIYAALTVGAAALSYHAFEKRFLRLKGRLR